MDILSNQAFALYSWFLRDFQHFMITLILATARPSGVLLILPIFLRASLSNLVKIVMAIALSLPIIQFLMVDLPVSTPPLQLVFIGAKEILFGIFIGLLLGVPFWSIQAVGEMMDNQRGTSSLPVEEPATKTSSSATAILLSVVSIAGFLAFDGFHIMLDVIYESYVIFPLPNFIPNYETMKLTVIFGLMDKIFKYMLVVAGPAVTLLFIIDLGLLMLSRAAPSFNIIDLSPSAKSIVFILFIGIYLVFLLDYIEIELGTLRGLPNVIRDFLP